MAKVLYRGTLTQWVCSSLNSDQLRKDPNDYGNGRTFVLEILGQEAAIRLKGH